MSNKFFQRVVAFLFFFPTKFDLKVILCVMGFPNCFFFHWSIDINKTLFTVLAASSINLSNIKKSMIKFLGNAEDQTRNWTSGRWVWSVIATYVLRPHLSISEILFTLAWVLNLQDTNSLVFNVFIWILKKSRLGCWGHEKKRQHLRHFDEKTDVGKSRHKERERFLARVTDFAQGSVL